MVDVVFKLIWYRLGETAANMAEAADNVYEHFTTKSWLELDPVNVLLLWWLVLAAGIVLAVNFYFRAVDAAKGTQDTTEGSTRGSGSMEIPVVPEADWEWVNSVIKWFYLNFRDTTDYLDAWLTAVNEKCRTQQNESNMLVQFTGLQRGTFLPKVTSVHSAQEDNHLILTFSVSLHQVYLELQASTDAIQATDCGLVIHKLKGEIKLKVNMTLGEDIQLTAKFAQTPNMEMKIIPKKTEDNQTELEKTEGAETTSRLNQEQEQPTDNNVVDLHTLEHVILNAFSTASMTFSIKPHVRTSGIHLNFIEKRNDRKTDMGLKFGNGAPPKPPRVQDRRLLVKIIKANNLACTDPYCVVEMDYPSQKHITSVVKGTQNPFWDEHFLFDLNQDSRELKFELYDRDQVQGEDFLGTASSRLDDLREYPSSRQIIPLTGKPGHKANICGTITVEFLFMEPAEAQQYQEQVTPVQVSPRRRIETSRTVTPGGTHITTTTTTTEKRKDQKLEASIHESPSKIEKAESHVAESPSNKDVVVLNGTDDIAEAAIRELQQQRQKGKTPAKTSTIIITSVYRTESPPEEDHVETDQSSIEPSSPTSPTEKGAKRKSLGKRFLNRLRKPRSHSVERSSNIPEKNLLKPPGRTTGSDYHRDTEPAGNLRRSRSIGGSIRRLFGGRRSRQDNRDESDVEIPGEGDAQLSHKSRSLTGSLRKLFRRKRKRGGSSPGPSRESSMSRASTRSQDQDTPQASITAQAGDSPRQSVASQ